MTKPFLFVGLDQGNYIQDYLFARELNHVKRDFGIKLNLDFFVESSLSGNAIPLQRTFDLGRPIFADLKMWNGKRTMNSVADGLIQKGVDYINVYSHAGEDFIKSLVERTKGTKTKILGLTVLSHYTDKDCMRLYGYYLKDAVKNLSNIAYSSGCHGIIVPGTSLDAVKNLPLEKLVPGVRPGWYGKTGENYQRQEVSIREAVEGGATLLVCSSPIRKSPNRLEALERTLDEIEKL
jgi:orotidine-5'-phosphate decarboxylase